MLNSALPELYQSSPAKAMGKSLENNSQLYSGFPKRVIWTDPRTNKEFLITDGNCPFFGNRQAEMREAKTGKLVGYHLCDDNIDRILSEGRAV